jgi:uncharacterized protein YodC (DUF2158 family)
MAYEVGKKVRLNSGGPEMTVEAVIGEKVRCVWFDKATLRTAEFVDTMIEDADRWDELLDRIKAVKKAENQTTSPAASGKA